MTFSELVDAADQLSLDEQQALLDILRGRVAESNRQRLIHEVQEARNEFAEGKCKPTSVSEIMDEIQP